jgi:hypothetical protein
MVVAMSGGLSFTPMVAPLKGLAHESDAWSKAGDRISATLQAVMVPALADFAREPAFRWDSTGFAYFYLPSKQQDALV